MNCTSLPRLTGALAAVIFLLLPQAASACTVCMGDPNSAVAGAMNGAIFLMLGFLGMIFALLGAFAFYLVRRANSPLPPHAQFAGESEVQEDF